MRRARRRIDPAAAVLLSVAAHAVVLTALALHAPKLALPIEEAGPPEPVIPVLIMPRVPPPPPGSLEPPRPIRLHRRQLRPGAEPPPIEPLAVEQLPAAPAAPRGPAPPPRVTVQPTPSAQLSTVLRQGAIGCANPSLLSREERAACDERFGRGTKTAPVLPPTPSAAAKESLGRAAAAKEAYRNYKRAPMPPGVGGAGGYSAQPWDPGLPPLPAPPPMRP